MKFSAQLLELPDGNTASPSKGPLPVWRQFLHIVPQPHDVTVAQLFKDLDARCREGYLDPAEWPFFWIRNLQDERGNDLPVTLNLGDIFQGDPEPITIRIVQARIDRDCSLPVHSTLRPAGFQPEKQPHRSPGAPQKRLRYGIIAQGSFNPDKPINSSERDDLEAAGRVLSNGAVGEGHPQAPSQHGDSRTKTHQTHEALSGSQKIRKDNDGFAVPAKPAIRKAPTHQRGELIPKDRHGFPRHLRSPYLAQTPELGKKITRPSEPLGSSRRKDIYEVLESEDETPHHASVVGQRQQIGEERGISYQDAARVSNESDLITPESLERQCDDKHALPSKGSIDRIKNRRRRRDEISDLGQSPSPRRIKRAQSVVKVSSRDGQAWHHTRESSDQIESSNEQRSSKKARTQIPRLRPASQMRELERVFDGEDPMDIDDDAPNSVQNRQQSHEILVRGSSNGPHASAEGGAAASMADAGQAAVDDRPSQISKEPSSTHLSSADPGKRPQSQTSTTREQRVSRSQSHRDVDSHSFSPAAQLKRKQTADYFAQEQRHQEMNKRVSSAGKANDYGVASAKGSKHMTDEGDRIQKEHPRLQTQQTATRKPSDDFTWMGPPPTPPHLDSSSGQRRKAVPETALAHNEPDLIPATQPSEVTEDPAQPAPRLIKSSPTVRTQPNARNATVANKKGTTEPATADTLGLRAHNAFRNIPSNSPQKSRNRLPSHLPTNPKEQSANQVVVAIDNRTPSTPAPSVAASNAQSLSKTLAQKISGNNGVTDNGKVQTTSNTITISSSSSSQSDASQTTGKLKSVPDLKQGKLPFSRLKGKEPARHASVYQQLPEDEIEMSDGDDEAAIGPVSKAQKGLQPTAGSSSQNANGQGTGKSAQNKSRLASNKNQIQPRPGSKPKSQVTNSAAQQASANPTNELLPRPKESARALKMYGSASRNSVRPGVNRTNRSLWLEDRSAPHDAGAPKPPPDSNPKAMNGSAFRSGPSSSKGANKPGALSSPKTGFTSSQPSVPSERPTHPSQAMVPAINKSSDETVTQREPAYPASSSSKSLSASAGNQKSNSPVETDYSGSDLDDHFSGGYEGYETSRSASVPNHSTKAKTQSEVGLDGEAGSLSDESGYDEDELSNHSSVHDSSNSEDEGSNGQSSSVSASDRSHDHCGARTEAPALARWSSGASASYSRMAEVAYDSLKTPTNRSASLYQVPGSSTANPPSSLKQLVSGYSSPRTIQQNMSSQTTVPPSSQPRDSPIQSHNIPRSTTGLNLSHLEGTATLRATPGGESQPEEDGPAPAESVTVPITNGINEKQDNPVSPSTTSSASGMSSSEAEQEAQDPINELHSSDSDRAKNEVASLRHKQRQLTTQSVFAQLDGEKYREVRRERKRLVERMANTIACTSKSFLNTMFGTRGADGQESGNRPDNFLDLEHSD